ncbi:MAG: hypothetical protein BGN85_11400 [Alphaproteobacteria bacterium 64-11]|nr:hypothetical protein [Alphaproteobacteria bacterium]OJU08101.1 MAG: hypothetical protein BGN85_11400 [Alphaproteobacteria bacterium 64-11]
MRKALRILMLPLLLGLAACAGVPEPAPPLRMQSTAPPVGIYYQGAVKAILRRDYATALDYLQAARAADPQDVPTLNAFGVVYDKLGRFDLSRRYYAQAVARDPSSRVVAANMVYSRMLEATEDGGLPPPEAAPGPTQTVVTIPAMPVPEPELPKIRIAQLEPAPPRPAPGDRAG